MLYMYIYIYTYRLIYLYIYVKNGVIPIYLTNTVKKKSVQSLVHHQSDNFAAKEVYTWPRGIDLPIDHLLLVSLVFLWYTLKTYIYIYIFRSTNIWKIRFILS